MRFHRLSERAEGQSRDHSPDERSFHSWGPAAKKHLSPSLLCVRSTSSLHMSLELDGNGRRPMSGRRRQSSVRYMGAAQASYWCTSCRLARVSCWAWSQCSHEGLDVRGQGHKFWGQGQGVKFPCFHLAGLSYRPNVDIVLSSCLLPTIYSPVDVSICVTIQTPSSTLNIATNTNRTRLSGLVRGVSNWRQVKTDFSKKNINFYTRYWVLGPDLIPVYSQSALRWNLKSSPGSRLRLFSAKPKVTFPAEERHRSSTSTKLYCLVIEAYRCEQLAQGCYVALSRWELNPWPTHHKSSATLSLITPTAVMAEVIIVRNVQYLWNVFPVTEYVDLFHSELTSSFYIITQEHLAEPTDAENTTFLPLCWCHRN